MDLLFRIILFIISFFGFYIAFFLYENEEGKIQSRIEELWLRLVDWNIPGFNKRIVAAVVSGTNNFIDRLIGAEAFSRQSFSIGVFLAIISFPIGLFYEISNESDQRVISELLQTLFIISPISIIIGFIGIYFTVLKKQTLVLSFATIGLSVGLAVFSQQFNIKVYNYIFKVLPISIVSAAFLHVWFFSLFRRLIIPSRISTPVGLLFTLLYMSIFVFGFTFYFPHRLVEIFLMEDNKNYMLAIFFLTLSAMSCTTFIPIIVIITLSILLWLNRILWRFIPRFIYAVQRAKIIKQKKIIGLVSFYIFVKASFPEYKIINKLLKLFGVDL